MLTPAANVVVIKDVKTDFQLTYMLSSLLFITSTAGLYSFLFVLESLLITLLSVLRSVCSR